MTIEAMQRYFQERELGIQGATGEYAVLIPLVEREGELCLLFETRAETLVGHQPGEVCFPGGRREKGETAETTAKRETFEELGIPMESIEILAPLDWVQDISDRVVYPFLGKIEWSVVEEMKLSSDEVKNTFLVPLTFLMDYPEEVHRYPIRVQVDESFPYDRVGFPGYTFRYGWMDIPVYDYEGHIIWGMTGRMVRWLLQELHRFTEG